MKSLWYSILAVALVALIVSAQSDTQAPIRDGVFIHISHGADNPHRVLMALRMAEMMSEDHEVLVYFDIAGIDAVLKDSPDLQFQEFPSAKTQLEKLATRNVTVVACPTCLKVAGKTEADLAPQVKIANKEQFFTFTKGRILTIDY